VQECELDFSGSGYGLVMGYYKQGNNSIKGRELLD